MHGGVPRRIIRRRPHDDGEYRRHERRHADGVAPLHVGITQPGADHLAHDGRDEWRDTHDVGKGALEPHTLRQDGKERGEGVHRGDDANAKDHREDLPGVRDDVGEVTPCDVPEAEPPGSRALAHLLCVISGRRLTLVDPHAHERVLLLLRREEPCFLDAPRDQREHGQGVQDREDPLHQEDELPPFDDARLGRQQPVGDGASGGAGSGEHAGEDTHAEAQVLPRVELRHQVEGGRVVAGFEHAEEQAKGDQGGVAPDGRVRCRDDSAAEELECYEDPGAGDEGEDGVDDVEWHVCPREEGEGEAHGVAADPGVFDEAAHRDVSDVALVD